jgi:hypothetical protein
VAPVVHEAVQILVAACDEVPRVIVVRQRWELVNGEVRDAICLGDDRVEKGEEAEGEDRSRLLWIHERLWIL